MGTHEQGIQRYEPAVPIDELTPHPDNYREGDVGAIIQSIEEHGFVGSLIVQESTGYIVAGNHRWKAAKALGFTELPVIYRDMTDEMAHKYLLVDNRSSDLGTNDEQQIIDLLETLVQEGQTLAGTGYDEDDLDYLIRKVEALNGQLSDAFAEWQNMPEFKPGEKREAFISVIHFLTDDDADSFFALIKKPKSKAVWFPDAVHENNRAEPKMYVADQS